MADVPIWDPEVQVFVASVPDPATIKEKLAQNRREASFLRRLMKLASDAEAVRRRTAMGQPS